MALPLAAQNNPHIERAVVYLSEHVAVWPKENGCFSCHNNADGYRALTQAKSQGYQVPEMALRETRAWLANPAQWDQAAKNKMASDLKLARLQFALAGQHTNILREESDSGLWRISTGDLPGSPITWGTPLATALAYQQTKNPRALAYLKSLDPTHTVDLAAQTMILGQPEKLLARQNPDGSWGPRPKSPGEVFDTAIAILALAGKTDLTKAREYLEREQLSTGAWPETTRPSGGTSYAHHISTTAWATLALLRLEALGR